MSRAIVARYTQEQLEEAQFRWQKQGAEAAYERMRQEKADLQMQRERINIEQTKAVTELMRAAGENLSKAGYLIGKLNKDNSR